MQETWVRFLGWEVPLEEKMATDSNIIAWEIPWTEGPGGLQYMGSQKVRHNWVTETGEAISVCIALSCYIFFLTSINSENTFSNMIYLANLLWLEISWALSVPGGQAEKVG